MKKLYIFILLMLMFVACSDSNNDTIVPEVPEPPTSGSSIGDFRDGITVISDDSLAFVLFAPGKQSVYLIGDFNDWRVSDAYKMHQVDDRFWLKIGGLEKGKEYICQYLIDNKIRVADPYASKVSDPINDKYINQENEIYPGLIAPTTKTTGLSMVVNTSPAKYTWTVSDFSLQNPESMVVYELLIRDFTEKRSVKGVQEKLNYIKSLGVNAIELMPFNEFEGNDSWGYNPSFYFATDKAYGASNDYKAFIDECHANGIAVIMDMVLNHSFSQSPMVTMYKNDNDDNIGDNPWYNKTSPNTSYSWGYDFNHESKYTQAFVDSVCSYWMKEYKVDGFRFDFTKGFTNTKGDGYAYDQPRVNILKRMVNEIRKRNPDAIIIFEHLADNLEEKELSNDGIYLWGNVNYNFNEATMGWGKYIGDYNKPKGDISWASYMERGWTKPNLVAYMESHDEERIMFKNNSYGDKDNPSHNVQELPVGLARTEAAAVILMSLPGPKMIWQFGELGYDYSINAREDGYWISDYEDGRYRTAKKPIKWDYFDVTERKGLHDVYAKMNKLHTTNPIFSTTDYTIGITDNFKQILLKSAEGYVCAIANFDVVPATAKVNFGKTGTWQDYFTSKTLIVNEPTQEIILNPGEYYLYFSK